MTESAEPILAVESPCIGTCTLGPDGLCVGCFRSADEIGAWLTFSAAQRSAIMKVLPERGQQMFDDEPTNSN